MMVYQYKTDHDPQVLETDIAGEFPIYIYWSKVKNLLLYSTSIKKLLKHPRIDKPLKLSFKSISFLLQSGVVPPPMTVYEEIYILGIGEKASIFTKNNKIQIKFTSSFPFLSSNRKSKDGFKSDDDLILKLVSDATVNRINENKPNYLFHSAGKDSNTIVLALAEKGLQDKITLVTHKSKGNGDESAICRAVAKKLGFKQIVLNEIDDLNASHKKIIKNFFKEAPFPCTDNVSLAYPLYTYQLPELIGANIIDGSGNDVYMGYIPKKSEYQLQKLSKFLKPSRVITKRFSSINRLNFAGRTRSEHTGLFGLSYHDSLKIFPQSIDVSKYWLNKDNEYKNWNYIDFRSMIRGTIIEPGIFQRKVRNFADVYNSNIIFPWFESDLVKYFSTMPKEELYDTNSHRNKIILRKILKDRLSLDSDEIGKLGFNYDYENLIFQNWEWIKDEISNCSYWQWNNLEKLLEKLKYNATQKRKNSKLALNLLYRIYLISGWLNQNQYTRKTCVDD